MTRRMGWIVAAAGAGAAGVALYLVGCSSQAPQHAATAPESQPTAGGPAAHGAANDPTFAGAWQITPPQQPPPPGPPPPGILLERFSQVPVPGESSVGWGFNEVPEIDLHQALQQSGQGGGGAQPPPNVWSVTGITQDSLGLAAAKPGDPTSPAPGIVNYPEDWPTIRREDGRGVAPRPIRVSADDEIWVIQRLSAPHEPDPHAPTCGTLFTTVPSPSGEPGVVPLPLKKTSVQASVLAYISTVDVEQRFHNPFDGTIEAVYTFPLPENAAVNEFLMTIGDRTIRGIIREKEQAQQVYEQAKRAGHTASLLTQERPNVFTQRVANIQPGRDIDVTIRYYSTLTYSDGWYSFVFPMVVGPRFNPPGTTDGVGAVGRGQYAISGQKTEVQHLAPGERSAHEIDLKVAIDAGVEIEELVSPTHVIKTERPRGSRAVVRLSDTDDLPNKDFVLSWRIAGDSLKSALLTHKDERGGFFTLMLVPPLRPEKIERSPMEMVFVVDRSGSMSGKPIEQAREAVERGLRHLDEGDSFQVIDFSNTASQLGDRPLEFGPESLRAGLAYLSGLDAQGGTMMINGLRAALDFPHDPRRLRFVAFLTDGFIGNERDILAALDDRLADARVFSFGVGSAPNRFLMDEMATLGRGAAAYVGPDDPAGDVMDLFFQRVSRPALRDVSIEWSEGAQVDEVYPARLPDVFVGRPLIVTGRFRGEFDAPVTVRGRRGNSWESLTVKADGKTARSEGLARGALPSVWARTKIADLSRREVREGRSYRHDVERVALDFSLMSAYTAFVAVDSMTRTADRVGTTVGVAVPVPEGVKYETTVQERP